LIHFNIVLVVYSATNPISHHPFGLRWTFSLCVTMSYNK
jgi:hypothetical protein